MARKKVNLAWIPNDATRRATFKKRKRGLIKKAYELSVLCNVKTCVVIYGPHDPKPEVWPSQNETLEILSKFKELPEQDQCKKMVNQEGFLRQRVEKVQEQIYKVDKENRALELKLLMHDLLSGKRRLSDLSFQEAKELERLIDERTREVQQRMDTLRSNPNGIQGDELELHGVPHVRIPHDELAIIRGRPSHDEHAIIPGSASHDELAFFKGGSSHDELAIMPLHDEMAVDQPAECKDWFNIFSSGESAASYGESVYMLSDSYFPFF
ncbi:hypothetical protein LUZ60_007778 [Juncus effusus]|nr:hypothetical protein LUZ60_007778 [Juncus effusus]